MTDVNPTSEDDSTPPPTVEERQTETVDDEVKPEEQAEPEPEDDGSDVSGRLDMLEKELAALKAMLDTLGYDNPAPSDDEDDGGVDGESIEDLFD